MDVYKKEQQKIFILAELQAILYKSNFFGLSSDFSKKPQIMVNFEEKNSDFSMRLLILHTYKFSIATWGQK